MPNGNDRVISKLISAFNDGNVVALIGAGSSHRVGYPLWNGFADVLAMRANELEPQLSLKGGKVIDRVSRSARILGEGRVREAVVNEFKPRSPPFDHFHQLLLSLPFRHFLTTNYDEVLESALNAAGTRAPVVLWRDRGQRGEFIRKLTKRNAGPHIVHLHGTYDNPDSAILTHEDYEKNYLDSDDIRDDLHILLRTMSIVAVGTSLEDPYFGPLFQFVKRRSGGQANHFAILPGTGVDSEAEVRRECHNLGVDCIVYGIPDAADREHAGLLKVVERLASELRHLSPASHVVAASTSTGKTSIARKQRRGRNPATTVHLPSAYADDVRRELKCAFSKKMNAINALPGMEFDLLVELEIAASRRATIGVVIVDEDGVVEPLGSGWRVGASAVEHINRWRRSTIPTVVVWRNSAGEMHWTFVSTGTKRELVFFSRCSRITPGAYYDLIWRIAAREALRERWPTTRFAGLPLDLLPLSLTSGVRAQARAYYRELIRKPIENPILGVVRFSWHGWRHLTRRGRRPSVVCNRLRLLPAVWAALSLAPSTIRSYRSAGVQRGAWTFETRHIELVYRYRENLAGSRELVVILYANVRYETAWQRLQVALTGLQPEIRFESAYLR